LKKKRHVEELEKRVEDLRKDNERLRTENERLRTGENERLRMEVEILRRAMGMKEDEDGRNMGRVNAWKEFEKEQGK